MKTKFIVLQSYFLIILGVWFAAFAQTEGQTLKQSLANMAIPEAPIAKELLPEQTKNNRSLIADMDDTSSVSSTNVAKMVPADLAPQPPITKKNNIPANSTTIVTTKKSETTPIQNTVKVSDKLPLPNTTLTTSTVTQQINTTQDALNTEQDKTLTDKADTIENDDLEPIEEPIAKETVTVTPAAVTTSPNADPKKELVTQTVTTTVTEQKIEEPKKVVARKQVKKTKEEIKPKIARRPRRKPVSMADMPKTEEEKKIIEQAINIPEAGVKIAEERKQNEAALKRLEKSGTIYLGDYLTPWEGLNTSKTIEMNFENAEVSSLLKFLEDNLNITFILDDYIEPQRADGLQPITGTKISFKSTVPLTLKQVWELGATFLEMAGFSIIPTNLPRTYRVTLSNSKDKPSANREPLPTFIGIDPELLPNSDTKIRYIYFAENADLGTISQIIEAMKSASAGPLIEVPQLKAVIITDKAANIKSLMQILQEIDRVSLPETLAVIRLRHTDARTVRELYYRLIGKDPNAAIFNPFARQRKPSTTQYFTEATRVFEEPRTNSLIVLGTRENIKRFEDFIIKYIDKTLDLPFSPLHILQLKYIDAASVAKILNETIQRFNSDPANAPAAAVGGVRDGNKFFKPTVRITEEPSGNRLIVNADYEEYLKIRKIIEELDVEQPQVAIKVLILEVNLTDTKQLGTQLRNKVGCCDGTGGSGNLLGPNISYQSAQLGPVVTRNVVPGTTTPVNGAERLLGNLISLASAAQTGNTLITLGQDMFGFFGLLQMLQSITRVSVIANPFLVTTHKYKAEITIGQTQRTQTAIVQGQSPTDAFGDLSANLRVIITPQISYDDMVTLSIYVELGQFVPNTNQTRIINKISTESLLANREVLALGGLIQDNISITKTKVPILGDIPLIGWLFKNEVKTVNRTSLLILISPEIIKPFEPDVAQRFTYTKIDEVKQSLYQQNSASDRRDPIHRWFFKDNKDKESSTLDKFTSIQQRYIDESQKGKTEVVASNDKSAKSVNNKSLLDFVDKGKSQEGMVA